MNYIENLTDEQLINLFQNQMIDVELKKSIISEIDKRDLDKIVLKNQGIDNKTKVKIIFTSYFLFKSHIEKSSLLLSQGNKKGYKQYWTFFIYGIIFYTIILLIVAKYLINPN